MYAYGEAVFFLSLEFWRIAFIPRQGNPNYKGGGVEKTPGEKEIVK